MIYAKFLACFNPRVKGVFVDSPNIRLEIEHPNMKQRGKYLVDFSQMDIEVRRPREITLDEYYDAPEKVAAILEEDHAVARDFFERLIVAALSRIADRNEENLQALGVAIEVPSRPFPVFRADELKEKFGAAGGEAGAGATTPSQFFWIRGLLRENYDLVYPYLRRDGSRVRPESISSTTIYNYDICAKSIIRKDRTQTPALEVLSGGIREWLFDPIVARLVDNGIIPEPPRIKNGNVENIDRIGGYAPFLLAAGLSDENGKSCFPETFGGGIGIERTLFAILRGPEVGKVDDITFFGKNPDSHQIYLF
jgi:aspartyl/asparaginyl-tRNA synthetase